jgi:hypothetical protein
LCPFRKGSIADQGLDVASERGDRIRKPNAIYEQPGGGINSVLNAKLELLADKITIHTLF